MVFGLETLAQSIGRVAAFFGNFMVAVRAYAYLLHLGAEGFGTLPSTRC